MTQLNSLTASVETLAEILNALFDIYGDAAFDYDGPVFVNGGFLEQLNRVFPSLKTKACLNPLTSIDQSARQAQELSSTNACRRSPGQLDRVYFLQSI